MLYGLQIFKLRKMLRVAYRRSDIYLLEQMWYHKSYTIPSAIPLYFESVADGWIVVYKHNLMPLYMHWTHYDIFGEQMKVWKGKDHL
jgi:hypothetical protein